MLIKCPECGKDVSDKADVCIHCGFPLKRELIEINTENNICCINGIDRDLSEHIKNLNNPIYKPLLRFNEKFGLSTQEGWTLLNILKEFEKAPLIFDTNRLEEYEQKLEEIEEERLSHQLHCPTCKSTDIRKISTTSKALNTAAFGILGTKRFKQWHCKNCGHEW